jgi:hypothetical protein
MNPRLMVAVAIGLACAASPSSAQGPASVQVDLSTMDVNVLPGDFEAWRTGQGQPAHWTVVKDETATQGRAIAQVSTDRTDYRFPLAVYKPFSGKNVEVTVRFKPIEGKVDEAGGVAVRLTTPDDYYVARANALEDNVRFYRVVKGKREQLASANAKVAPKRWHTLMLRAQGDRFTVAFDGKELINATDKTFAGDGKVALWTKADSVTYFDQIVIKPLETAAR